MKLVENKVETFSMGQKEVSQARIQASAKAFEILSSSLYSNNILAIIRELCANAKDSHTAAGKPLIQFDVQCPNDLDPQFKVRDYGVGMDHNFVMTRLNTYFDSTKNDSNDEIGGFGLGIKSVFSYTSSFMITCYNGTHRRVYTYQIGSTGLPEISFLIENESSEPCGVEVSVPVKKDDYQAFRMNMVEALSFYSPRPNIIGMSASDFNIEKIYEGTNWAIYKNNGVLSEMSYIEMGDVIYPIPNNFDMVDEIPTHMKHYINQVQHLNRGRGNNDAVVVYKGGIGQIDITPNREQIKLTPKSKEQIKEFEKIVKTELSEQIQGFIDSFDCSYWNILKEEKVSSLLRSSICQKFNINTKALTYKGYPIDSYHNFRIIPGKESKLVDKLIKIVRHEIYYDRLTSRSDNIHQDIEVSNRDHNSKFILVGPKGFSKTLTYNQVKSLGNERPIIISIECKKNEDIQEVVDYISSQIPDFDDRIIKWNDIKDELAKVQEPNMMVKHSIVSSSYDQPEAEEFELSKFQGMTQVIYELINENKNSYYSSCSSMLTDVLYYLDDATVKAFKKAKITEAYSLTQKQVDELTQAGFRTVKFTDKIKPVLNKIAKEFADSRPTMTLKEYMKPLTSKNPRICLSTHYKALKNWLRASGQDEEYKLLLILNDESSSSYRRTDEDNLFRKITGQSIKAYITEHKIVGSKKTSNQVAVDIATKAPLCGLLVSSYTDKEVLAYVQTQMGWSSPTVVLKNISTVKKA